MLIGCKRPIIGRVECQQKGFTMEDLLQYLEDKIQSLVLTYHSLQRNHVQLKQKEKTLQEEKHHLLSNQEKAASKIETMLKQLKSLEVPL